MKRNTRKGFTGIELVIVIAIIAILATALIPTFGGLINSANKTADTQLVKNLNMALLSDTDGVETMSEALALAEEYGYNVAKINAKATGNEILWDSVNNEFCYLNGETIEYITNDPTREPVADIDYWVISNEIHPTYSTYLYNYTGDGSEAITKGLDVGDCTLFDITYAYGLEQTVTIRTNGGTLRINAAMSTVKHYGDAEEVVITAVDSDECYHVFGNVEKLSVQAGKVIVAETANVYTMIVDEANTANVELDVIGEIGTLYASEELVTTGKPIEASSVITAGTEGWKVVKTKDDLIAALAAKEAKIALGADIVFDHAYADGANIFNVDYEVILNLNSYTVSARFVCDSSSTAVSNALFNVKMGAKLTVTGSGKIAYEQVGTNFGWNAYSSTISCQRATVIIDGPAIIQHMGGTDMAYAIDVLSNTGPEDAKLTVNAGLVQSPYRAIRAFCNSETGTACVTINGGTVRSTNNHAIWMQDSSAAKNNKGLLTITGGLIESNTSKPVYIWTQGEFDITVNVSGGTFKTNGALVIGEEIFRR